jgi:hypothetical protein
MQNEKPKTRYKVHGARYRGEADVGVMEYLGDG